MYQIQEMLSYCLEILSYWMSAKAEQCYALSLEMRAKAVSALWKSIV